MNDDMNDEIAQERRSEIKISLIAHHERLFVREQLDAETVAKYAECMREGVTFPPVVIVREYHENTGKVVHDWLADGYHRVAAAKEAGKKKIHAEIIHGTGDDAVRIALSANAAHGKPLTPGDIRRSFLIAIERRLVEPDDVNGVKRLLRISERLAREITAPWREMKKSTRDKKILKMNEEGIPQREISRSTGVPKSTVARVVAAGPKRHRAEMGQPEVSENAVPKKTLRTIEDELAAVARAVDKCRPWAISQGDKIREFLRRQADSI